MSQEDIRKKLDSLIQEKGFKYRELSLMLGRSDSYLHRFINYGKPSKLEYEDRVKLANLLDVDEQELSDRPLVKGLVKSKPNTINIDMLDVTACCGTGADITTEPVIGTWQMPLVDFNAMSLTSPDNIKIIKATGDSMTPTVQDGDYVFVDVSNQSITSDGVYVLRLPTGLSIKRIQNGLSGDVIVRSDNPAYEPLTAKLADVRILGRVVRILNQRKI